MIATQITRTLSIVIAKVSLITHFFGRVKSLVLWFLDWIKYYFVMLVPRNLPLRYYLLLVLTGLPLINLTAQLRVNNFMEYQLGNIPETEPADLSTLYNQTNIFYRQQNFSGFARVEQFYNSDSAANYLSLSQYRVKYDNSKLKITLGDFYETLGRGILLRTYEVKSGILEDRVYREKKAFYKDMEGASVAYSSGWFEIKGIYGRVLNNLTSVEDENRRPDLVEAISPGFSFIDQKVSVALMRVHTYGKKLTYSSVMLDGFLPFGLSYYGEYALRFSTDSLDKIDGFDQDIRGGYLGFSYSTGSLGLSLEFKDYQNMLIGTGVNVPPTLIKEHTYKLLNRSTHITDLTDESGYQAEIYYVFESGDVITFNHSLAKNDLYGTTYFFREYFAEYAYNSAKRIKIKGFIDYANDEFVLEKERYAAGAYIDIPMAKQRLISIESEFQQINREILSAENIFNFYNGIRIKTGADLSLAAMWEYTTDAAVADKNATTEIENRRHFLAFQGQYRFNMNHTLQLFIGERRGGPACSGGICYEVLDFKGIEFRLTSKF